MKIRSLTLKNIGVFEDETITFPEKKTEGAEIHILTGQNGTGKTTVLQSLSQSIDFIYDLTVSGIAKSYQTYNNFRKRLISDDSYCKTTFENNDNIILGSPSIVDELHFNVSDIIAFAYSGYRFVEHKDDINIKEKEDFYPLENALEFYKTYEYDYTLNQWLANTISKRSFARDEGNEEKANLINRNIKNLEKIIEAIIEKPIKFEPVYDTGIKIIVNIGGKKLDFDLLPDGLRSVISWLGDFIMRMDVLIWKGDFNLRMDALKWKDDLDLFDREFILFLDEIEVHLHPYWQRKILPVVQKTFKNAQIFITTHSPFIINSVDGAWIYELDLDEKGNSKVTKVRESNTADSYQTVIREVFEVNRFSEPLVSQLNEFTNMRNDILLQKQIDEKVFLEKATELANKNDEIKNTILFELRQLSQKTGKHFAI